RIKHFFSAIQQANNAGWIIAYHDRSDGGLLAALAEMAFAGRTGLAINLDGLGDDPLAILFNEELGAIIQTTKTNKANLLSLFSKNGLEDLVTDIGTLAADDNLSFKWKGKTCY